MDLKLLAQQLLGQNIDQQLAASNPYASLVGTTDALGNAIIQRAGTGEDSLGEILTAGLLTGAGKGLFTNLQNDYADNQRSSLDKTISDSLFGIASERPENISPELFGRIKDASALARIEDASAAEAAKASKKEDLELTRQKAIINNPELADQINAAFSTITGAPGAAIVEMPKPVISAPSVEEVFPGIESIDSKITRRASELKQQFPRLTANAALTEARKSVQDEVLAEKSAVDTVGDVRKSTRSMDEFLAQAEAGVSGAGKTGGFFGPVRDFASRIAAVADADEASKRAAQADLDASAQKAVAALRVPGSGAQSDIEYKGLLSAVPNSNRTPEENRRLLEGMKVLVQDRKDYADFIDYFNKKTGTARGADTFWDAYKKANPLVVKDGEKLVPNMNRTSWKEFDFSSIGKAPAKASSGAPAIGGTFNGEKVLSVRKIG